MKENIGVVDGFEIDIRKNRAEKTRPLAFSKSKGGFRLGVAYFSGVRPMETGGTVLDDLIWRRTEGNKAPISNKKMKELISFALKTQYFIDVTRVAYERKAGCRCGCSPGYVIHGVIDCKARDAAGVKEWYYSVKGRNEWYFENSYFHDELAIYVCTEEYANKMKLEAAARQKEELFKKATKFDATLADGANV